MISDVVPGSAERALEGDEHSFDATWTHPPLYLGGSDRLELPTLRGVLIEYVLQLAARYLAAKKRFPELDDFVLVTLRHKAIVLGSRNSASGPTDSAVMSGVRVLAPWLWAAVYATAATAVLGA